MPCKPTSTRNKPIMPPVHLSVTTSTWLPHTYCSTSSDFASSVRERDESRNFYPQKWGKFCFTFGLFGKGRVSFLSQGMCPMAGFLLRGAQVVFEGRACPSAAFSGKAGSWIHEGDSEPPFIPRDQCTPDCAEPRGHI